MVIENVEKLEVDIRVLGTGDKPDDSYKRNPGDAFKIRGYRSIKGPNEQVEGPY